MDERFFRYLLSAHPGSPKQMAVKWACADKQYTKQLAKEAFSHLFHGVGNGKGKATGGRRIRKYSKREK